MIIPYLLIFVGVVLILVSYLDIKYKQIPSVYLTGLIFIVLLMRPQNLIFGVILLVFGMLIRDFIHGVAGMDFGTADIKILIVIGLLFVSSHVMFLFLVVFAIMQFAYITLWKTFINKDDHVPFVPCLLAIFITLLLMGGLA